LLLLKSKFRNDCARSVKDKKALDLAIKQAIWFRGFLKEADFEQTKPTIFYIDNSAAILS
jgi:hypothetical protein